MVNQVNQKEYLLNVIEGGVLLELPIYDGGGEVVGMMRPVTKIQPQSEEVIAKITAWRNKYKKFFLTEFNATTFRTKKWLENEVLSEPTRLLFLIYSQETIIGHYGFKDLVEESVLLDNAVRGERGGHPMLMMFAAQALITWLFDVMQVNEVYGYTFANNPMGLRFNRDLGFTFTEKIPLLKQVEGEEVKWVIGKPGESSPDNHYYQKLVMYRD